MRRAAAVLLIGSFALSVLGAILYGRRTSGGPDVFFWERGSLIAGYVVAAVGVAVLLRRPPVAAAMVSRAATATFLSAAAVAVAAEASSLVEGSSSMMGGSSMTGGSWVWSVTVVLLFVAGALLGFALLKSRLAPTWVAWMVMVWNVAALAVVSIVTPEDMYFPFAHFLPLLVVGISVAVSRVVASPRP